MRVFIFLLLVFTVVTGIPRNVQRIIGGSATVIDEYPEMVSLLYNRQNAGFRHTCGGSILNNRSILTAAHCILWDTPSMWRSRLGSSYASSGGIILTSSLLIIHFGYNTRTFENDIGIIRTSSEIVFSNVIQPARIAGPDYILNDHQIVWATGWGDTTFGGPGSEQLQHVQIWVVNQNTCRIRYGQIGYTLTESMLCAGWLDVGGRDQCQNDSGGPLYHNGVVVGVCSWGEGCGLARYPGVNTRVSSFTNWITNNA